MQKALGFLLFIHLLFIFSFSSLSIALTKVQVDTVSRRRRLTLRQTDPLPDDFKLEVDPNLIFPNPRLKKAYCAFQEWKKVIYSDPQNVTGDWVGPDVCSYTGVFCSSALDDPQTETVYSIDLNFGDIAGHLVPHLGLLTDLGILHIHSNRFYGIFPKSFSNLMLLFELDASDNRFVGPFPSVVLGIPSLKFLDIRYNEFEGALPPELFDKELDAIVVNNNRFHSRLPQNMGNSPASMLVLSNNKFSGCIPKSFGHMPYLEQGLLSNNLLAGCLPEEVGMLQTMTLFDVSNNNIVGPLPKSLEMLKMVKRLDISFNLLTGKVRDSVCSLPALSNFTISNNFFNEIGAECEKISEEENIILDVKDNCLPLKPDQKPDNICLPMLSRPMVNCKTVGCGPRYSPNIVVPRHRKIPRRKPKPPPPVLPPMHKKTPPKPTPVPQPPKITPPPTPKVSPAA
ncbi:hypothetical protein L6452_23146 [Arctium lappa]|uniref:Uncharacterized protein n=1 Tax=Arctium lappa TaxID=4217 RepID=A0ACB9B2A4_ARCLA|nr:hypothetical protein L6452_23146 [Arctium lappa]